MPLHGKQPFIKKQPPTGLKPMDKVFYNKLTGECFDDFEEHFKRTVVCKSLVWSCELTMNSRLTYADALESERKARQCIKNMPVPLKRGMLFAITLTRRGRLVDLWEDVYTFVKDRYFIGEEVEALVDGQWIDCTVKSVLPPREADLAKSKKKSISPKASEDEKSADMNGESSGKDEKEADSGTSHEAWPPASVYRYHLEEIVYDDSSDDDDDEDEEDGKKERKKKSNPEKPPRKFVCPADDIRRPRGTFTRARNKLYVKMATEIEADGMLGVRSMASAKHDLRNMKIEQIFVGPRPVFQVGTKAKKTIKPVNLDPPKAEKKKSGRPPSTGTPKMNVKQGDIRKFIEKGSTPKMKEEVPGKSQTPKKTETLEERKRRMEEEIRAKLEAEKNRKKEEKERKKEEKKLYEELMKEWHKPKEDLELEDLKDLPAPRPIHCRVPNELFGGALEILEFFSVFHRTLEFGRWFPSGVTFDKVEEALSDQDIRGGLNDILTALLETIFQLQSDEEVEISSSKDKPDASLKEQFAIGNEENALAKAVELATAAAVWPRRYLGTPLVKLPRDACTISEVLRLHLLGSGAQCSESSKTWRYQQRGGYSSQDDPGIQFRLEHGEILQSLSSKLIFELTPAEKLSVLSCLIGQVMTYVGFRDAIDENFEKITAKRKELVQIRANEKKKAKEEATQRMKEKKEAKKEEKEAKKEGKSLEPPKVEDEEGPSRETRKQTEESRKKDEAGRRERDLHSGIAALQVQFALLPLGRDRAYRRYWACSSVPGVFVEDNDEFVGPCLPQPTPLPIKNLPSGAAGTQKQEDIRKFLTMHRAAMVDGGGRSPENGNSDKENDEDPDHRGKDPLRFQRKGTGEVFGQSLNKAKDGSVPIVKLESCPDADAKREMVNGVELEVGTRVFGMCTGQAHEDECPVHSSSRQRTVWAFYSTPAELEALIDGLNPRGFREKELRDHLIAEKDRLTANMSKCPTYKLDLNLSHLAPSRPEPRQKSERRKGGSAAFLSYSVHPPGTPSAVMVELTFRDRLLEMEEKIHLGNLGSLKVGERNAWREAIVSGEYDQQCDALSWAGGQFKEKQVLLTPRKEKPAFEEPQDEEEKKTKLKIRQLAAALLQLEQSVEPRYMQPPLGETAVEKKKKAAQEDEEAETSDEDGGEESGEEGADGEKKPPGKVKLTPLQRWELSLKNVSSFAQLFVHLEVLNSSVMWSRSTLHARCKVCRKKGDENFLLLCDGCNSGYHTTCLKPKMKSIPKGDWFCANCKPPEPEPVRERRPPRRRTFSAIEDSDVDDDDDDDEEEAEAEEEEVEEEEEAEAEQEEDDDVDETVEAEEDEEEVEDEDTEMCDEEAEQSAEDEDDETIETEVCDECGDGGQGGDLLVCCQDECSSQYHLRCLDPPLKKMPRGMWTCPQCAAKLAKKRDSKRGGKRDAPSGSKRGEKRVLEDGWEPRAKRRGAAVAADKMIHEASRRLAKSIDKYESEDDSEMDDDDDDDEEEEETTRRSSGTSTRRSDRKVREDVDLDIAVMSSLLHDLTKHENSWPFLKPVTKKDARDYLDRIKHPMDFGTMKGKLSNSEYRTNEDFLRDVQLILDNCREYNEEDTDIYACAENMQKYFYKKLDDLGLSHFHKSGLSGKKSKRV